MFIANEQNMRELKDALFIRSISGLDTSANGLKCLLQCSTKNKIHVFYSEHGLPIAYMAYALISKQTLYMLNTHKLEHIRDYELEEGKILHIMDMVITRDHSRLAGLMLKTEIFKKRLICGRKNGEFRIYQKKGGKYKKVRLCIDDAELENRSVNTGNKRLKLVSLKKR